MLSDAKSDEQEGQLHTDAHDLDVVEEFEAMKDDDIFAAMLLEFDVGVTVQQMYDDALAKAAFASVCPG